MVGNPAESHTTCPPAAPAARVRQVLIIGPPRSGTTLLAFLLAGGSGVLSLSEPYLARAILPDWRRQRFFRRLQREAGLPRTFLPPNAATPRFGAFLRQMAAAARLPIVAIKETFHERELGRHWDYWRNESILDQLVAESDAAMGIVRHPFDTAASTVKLAGRWVVGWTGLLLRPIWPHVPYFRDQTQVVRTSAANWSRFAEWAMQHRLRVVRYEDLVENCGTLLRDVCGHLGVPFEDGMLDYRRKRTAFGGLGDPGVMRRPPRPIDRAAIGRGGSLTPEQREIVAVECGAAARAFGYEL